MYATIRDELLAHGKAEGRTEGKAEMLLRLLTTRGLEVSKAQRERVEQCQDEELLLRWFERAVVAKTADAR
ncbi:MAG: hypothetical protein AB1Z98_14770 [Nannocystaceae bacterium]